MPDKTTEKFINIKADKLVQEAFVKAESLKTELNYYGMKENLTSILNKIGMDVKIHFYGSRIIGLADAESDLDIFIEYGNNFNNEKDVDRDRKALEMIHDAIAGAGLWSITNKILTASVPILCVTYKPGNIKCDISVSNGMGVKNSLLIRHLFDLQPESKKFYLFMKIFLKRYKRFKFDGYLLKLLVIFFLQEQKLFPSTKIAQEHLPVEYIGTWQVQLDPSRTLQYYGLNQMNGYKSYIPAFFTYYAEFKYETNVMSTYDGRAINRLQYNYREQIEDCELCTFGPINQMNNIGKYPSKSAVKYFKNLCNSLSKEFSKKYCFNY